MAVNITMDQLQGIGIWVASQGELLVLAAKIRDKRLVYRPGTKEDGRWGQQTEHPPCAL